MDDRDMAANRFANNIYGVVRKYITDKDMQNNLAHQCHAELYKLAYDHNLEITSVSPLKRRWRKAKLYLSYFVEGIKLHTKGYP